MVFYRCGYGNVSSLYILRNVICHVYFKHKDWVKKRAHIQKLAFSEKSTFFAQSSWNLVKIITTWGNHFHQVSWGLDKKCRFFTNGQFLNVGPFFDSDFIILFWKTLISVLFRARLSSHRLTLIFVCHTLLKIRETVKKADFFAPLGARIFRLKTCLRIDF